MSTMYRRHFIGACAAVVAGLSLAGTALAQTADAKAKVDAAKAAGTVGEQADGLLGLVTGDADAATKQAVAEINNGRQSVYREAATKNGVSVEAAGGSAFETVVKPRLKPGEFYKPAGSGWVRK
jgi:uncharacterized protein YdbL (DUF1318 family)